MPRRPTVTIDELLTAARPHGVITVRRLVELGVPPRTISRRCRPGGPWTRLLRGVVLLSTGTPTPTQRIAAAVLYAGDGVVTGFVATHAHGLLRGPVDERVRVLVTHGRHVTSHGFVEIERTTRLPASQVREGIRYASVARAVLDGARTLTRRDEVRAVVAEAVQRRRTSPMRLIEELDAGSCRGAALVRSVLAEVADGVRSVAEGWGRDAVAASPLPTPLWNPRLVLPDGLVVIPDAYWEDVGVAWQIDSREWHIDPERWAQTLRIRSLLQGAGALVVSTLPQALRGDPSSALAELIHVRALAAALPPPRVRVATGAQRSVG